MQEYQNFIYEIVLDILNIAMYVYFIKTYIEHFSFKIMMKLLPTNYYIIHKIDLHLIVG